ncbi:MAG: hypothetical protein A2622_14145 [Bdellovibrionales bacterium RIFCSPHIGHO2_01_FULL_40_29]|nr:MAG: hypothetical protein A2622_14145 [Bdellovibrionales bacterium RIFCSPHIGHO2_01_FULL_40_29]OFZ33662.1 MAG: hypothetical protein A3D17_11755 [Bdellovibrionales bacterium RIFCSPHIGHO2_02_FULL_40_15]
MLIETINICEIQNKYFQANFEIIKISCQIDVEKSYSIIQKYISKFGLMKKDGYSTYEGIGLQYHDSHNIYFDSIMSSDYTNSKKVIYNKINPLGEDLVDIYNTFSNIRLSRGRVIIAKPGFRMASHTDGAHINTLHIPILSSPDSIIVINNTSYHLPADGSAYLVNATMPHYAYNNSAESDRVHITFPIGPPSFKSWKRADLAKYDDYFRMMNIDITAFKLEISD